MKKLYLLICMCCLSAMAYSQSTLRATGDVNGDGKVDIEDITCLTNQILSDSYEYVAIYDGYIISVSTADAQCGTVSGGGVVAKGSTITLTATPKSGYKFDGWYQGETLLSTVNPYTFKPTGNLSIIGQFIKTGDSENPGGNLDPGQDE